MPHNELQGLFGEELLDVLAAAIGCSTSTASRDRGWDRVLYSEHDGLPVVAAQVKTSRRLKRSGESWRYQLERDTYNRLVGGARLLKLLVLIDIVPDPEAYAVVSESGIQLGCVPYWAQFPNATALGGHTKSKTVSVPCGNILTPQVLRTLCFQLGNPLEGI